MPVPVRKKSDFNEAFAELIGSEGTFTDSPKDPGNWTGGKLGLGVLKGTKYGIAANTFPQLDIKNLTLLDAKGIYRKHYWDAFQGDELDHEMAFQLFDGEVNSGLGNATKWLQQALGITVDGRFGPATLAAVKAADPMLLMILFNAYRLDFMTGLNNWPDAGRGWARRIAGNLIKSVTP